MNTKIIKVARIGYVSKGTVYVLTGVLAFSAAFGMGGAAKGKLGILEFLQKQHFGNVLLGLLALGLLCYGFWRFLQSIQDPEDIGTDSKAIGKRLGFFLSGLFYTTLAIFSVLKILNTSGTNGDNGKAMIPNEYLPFIFYAIAVG
ncbi:MAG: DUF1206 domain-containing protein, partial [Saonia sp.]